MPTASTAPLRCAGDDSQAATGGAPGPYVYVAAVSAARPAKDYTARIIPHAVGITVPLEDAHILWQR